MRQLWFGPRFRELDLSGSEKVSAFHAETALEEVADGRYQGKISKHWNIGGNPNGGYLLSIVLGAIARNSGAHPDPLSVTTHYLRPGIPDTACEVQVELIRRGRTLTTARAQLIQEGKTRLEVLTAFGDLSAPGVQISEDKQVSLTPPAIPGPMDCPERSGVAQGVELPIRDRIEIRVNPETQLDAGSTNGKAEVSGWIRMQDQSPSTPITAVMFTDAFPPALFGLLGVIGWVPTIELTVHVRRRPATPWLLGRFVTDDLQGGRMVESGALWDETGALVAQSRQLGLLLERDA